MQTLSEFPFLRQLIRRARFIKLLLADNRGSQVCPAKKRAGRIRLTQVSLAEIRPGEIGVDKDRLAETGSG